MKVLSLTYDQINVLHQQTGQNYFEGDGNGNFKGGSLQKQDGKTIYGVDKFVEHFPSIDISQLEQVNYVPQVEE